MRIATIASAFALAATIGLASMQADAYCVYNRGRKSIDVWGENCPKCYKGRLEAGEKGCCPGDKEGCRGDTWITFTGPHTKSVHYYCTAQVPAHGWVDIRNDGHPDVCTVYAKGGKVLSKDYKVASKVPKT